MTKPPAAVHYLLFFIDGNENVQQMCTCKLVSVKHPCCMLIISQLQFVATVPNNTVFYISVKQAVYFHSAFRRLPAENKGLKQIKANK